jgi:hypothetical protein
MANPKPDQRNMKLDWSKLLGFDQIKNVDHNELKLTDLGFSKIGGKSCTQRVQ